MPAGWKTAYSTWAGLEGVGSGVSSTYGTHGSPVRPYVRVGAAPDRKITPEPDRGGEWSGCAPGVGLGPEASGDGGGRTCSTLRTENGPPCALVGGGLCAACPGPEVRRPRAAYVNFAKDGVAKMT